MRKIFIYVIVFALLTGGCSKASTVSNTTDSENSKKLVVFMNSTPHTFREYDENGNMIDTVIYPSRYTTGTMLSGGDANGNLPDLLLLNKQPQYDYYKILELRFQYEYSDFA